MLVDYRYELEEEINSIYQGLKDNRVDPNEWEILIQSKEVDSYEIQNGDNLWDVSKTIFGSGFFWPKLCDN